MDEVLLCSVQYNQLITNQFITNISIKTKNKTANMIQQEIIQNNVGVLYLSQTLGKCEYWSCRRQGHKLFWDKLQLEFLLLTNISIYSYTNNGRWHLTRCLSSPQATPLLTNLTKSHCCTFIDLIRLQLNVVKIFDEIIFN